MPEEKSLKFAELTSRLDFKIVIAIVIAIGVFLRFFHLGFQDYWHDEATTSLNIAGHTKPEAFRFLIERPRQFGELLTYCAPCQDFTKVWKCWTTEQPAKTPIFYILEYFWVITFGDSTVTMRLLPALFGLLQLPAYFWLGMELFRSRTCAWLMVALQAISPVAILYAQEARDYSLYTATLALVCATFLHAVRISTKRNWFLYGLALTVSLYSCFLTNFAVAAQLIFLIARRQFKQLRQFIIAVAGASFLFSPWIWLNLPKLIHGYPDHTVLNKRLEFLNWLDLVLCNYWMPVFYPGKFLMPHLWWLNKFTGLAATYYSLYKIGRVYNHPGPAFLISLVAVGSAPYIIYDLISGGIRATIVRYMIHVHLVVVSCIAYAFAANGDWQNSWKKRVTWFAVFIGFCMIAIDSTLSISTSHTTILKLVDLEQKLRPLADDINRQPQPATVVSALGLTNHVQMFALSRAVKPETRLIFAKELTLKDMPDGVDKFYLITPTPELVDGLKQSGYELQPIRPDSKFWKVRRPSDGSSG